MCAVTVASRRRSRALGEPAPRFFGDDLLFFDQRAAERLAFRRRLDDHALALAVVQALAIVLRRGTQALALAGVDAVAAALLFLVLAGGMRRARDAEGGDGDGIPGNVSTGDYDTFGPKPM